MISKLQRCRINNWLHGCLWMLRAKKQLSDDCFILLGLPEYAPLQESFITKEVSMLLEYGSRYQLTGLQFLDWIRKIIVFCPIKNQEEWQYTTHLMNTYYPQPNDKLNSQPSGTVARLDRSPDE